MKASEAHRIAIAALNGRERRQDVIKDAYDTLVDVAQTSYGTEAFRLAERFPAICNIRDLDWLNAA